MGAIAVPAERYWGAQTQRSLQNFRIGTAERMPLPLIHALALVKKAAARANVGAAACSTGSLGAAIADAADEVIAGKPTRNFRWSSGRPARAPRPT